MARVPGGKVEARGADDILLQQDTLPGAVFCLAISSCTDNPESAFQTAGYAETVARLQQKVSLTHPQRGYVDATQRAWAAMLRTLDRVSPVYRD